MLMLGTFNIGGCGCGGGSDGSSDNNAVDSVINISGINGVVPPSYGEIPVTEIAETSQYSGTVSWSDSPVTFAATTVYTATITLTVKNGYTLSGLAENFFSLAGAASITNSADSGVVTVVFPATGVTTTVENSESGFVEATTLGAQGSITVGSQTIKMNYANDQDSITFPTGTDDSGTATITTRFFLSETEVTNALFAKVLQWARNNGKIVETVGVHNEVSTTIVKYGGRYLLSLDGYGSGNKITYNADTDIFSVVSGYENHPVGCVSWYGAVMFCNWLTWMRDGNALNVVYTSIDTTWNHTETVENTMKNGYRLPSSMEFEYASRYRGGDSTNTVTDYTDPYFTKGDSASGATANVDNNTATSLVAVYGSSFAAVKSKTANTLGLYDMSGNLCEWCSDLHDTHCEPELWRVVRGGDIQSFLKFRMKIGYVDAYDTERFDDSTNGFRFARTR